MNMRPADIPDPHGDNPPHETSGHPALTNHQHTHTLHQKDGDGTTPHDCRPRGIIQPTQHQTIIILDLPWDSEAGRHAAQLLPSDDSGYRIQPKDCEFLGISPDQVEAWAHREAPLGMTPTEFRDFSNSLYDALAREASRPKTTTSDCRVHRRGFFSGEHKSLDLDLQNNPEAQARVDSWFGTMQTAHCGGRSTPCNRLGLDDEPSDYDSRFSSRLDGRRHVAKLGG